MRDTLAVEEPLEIVVDGAPYAVTMRMPGDDTHLVMGFLLTEGVIASREDILSMNYCQGSLGERRIFVELRRGVGEARRQRQEFLSKSSCGLCGKVSFGDVHTDIPRVASVRTISRSGLLGLKRAIEARQEVFQCTGATHFAAIFDARHELLAFAEDIGRHNALDKAIGAVLAADAGNLAYLGIVSSRLSFEMVQKAGALGLEVLAGLSVATNLAVEMAESLGITLIGHMRATRMNVYTRAERIISDEELPSMSVLEELLGPSVQSHS
ncbi:formate dehydrogenase family accessory protein FdhD [Desulfocurvibacter africanus PCS]|uniref:Sulfur carrier protein FdhD n=1 Tax=Desulfocurvibacter africanus PCS TaxID=1262666 RepID=M5PQU0_DESAF|nr:formate dehydrogenase family accessory protein FdhD [Desulfocurvibacter africanus PCS]